MTGNFTRKGVTEASRVMLPTYVIVNAFFAWVYITDPKHNLEENAALSYPRDQMPLWVWGTMFLISSSILLLAMLIKGRNTAVLALGLSIGCWLVWGILLTASIFTDPQASPGSSGLAIFAAVACFASALSVWKGES